MDEVKDIILMSGQFTYLSSFSVNIFIWAVALCCHAACKNFAGLFVVRLVLGMAEGCVTASFMIITSMFYTRKEQTLRFGYWCEFVLVADSS